MQAPLKIWNLAEIRVSYISSEHNLKIQIAKKKKNIGNPQKVAESNKVSNSKLVSAGFE